MNQSKRTNHNPARTPRRKRLTLTLLSLFLVVLLASCNERRIEYNQSNVANPDEQAYGTSVVMPPGDLIGDVPEGVVDLYKQRVPNQYEEKPLWTF